eukprot:m.134631 g.134631  ORF g.134631 m.134631 type:complete len:87 (+) comp38152_c0_seq10:1641-1901(+)
MYEIFCGVSSLLTYPQVVVCGKSVNLMMNVDKLRGVLRSKLPDVSRPSQLYSQFLRCLREALTPSGTHQSPPQPATRLCPRLQQQQ